MASTVKRRRTRQAVSRPKVVQFSLTEDEFDKVSASAAQSGMARGAFAAEATLAAARGVSARAASPLREVLVELMSAAGLVRRGWAKLNPGGARLDSAGQRGDDLPPPEPVFRRGLARLVRTAEERVRRRPRPRGAGRLRPPRATPRGDT